MATSIPADLIRAGDRLGRIAAGRAADLVRLDAALALRAIWRDGDFHNPRPASGRTAI
ncbi:MAG: hypothetical protein ACU0BE_13530 [Paracoccus sp. (in: a-proteobacteria)]